MLAYLWWFEDLFDCLVGVRHPLLNCPILNMLPGSAYWRVHFIQMKISTVQKDSCFAGMHLHPTSRSAPPFCTGLTEPPFSLPLDLADSFLASFSVCPSFWFLTIFTPFFKVHITAWASSK